MEINTFLNDEAWLGWKAQNPGLPDAEIVRLMARKIERIGMAWRVEHLRRLEQKHETETCLTPEEEIAFRKDRLLVAGKDPNEIEIPKGPEEPTPIER